jgi:hypothetical protein
MAGSNLTTVAYIYKRAYSDKQVGDLAKRFHPLTSMIEKRSKRGTFNGSAHFYAIRTGNPQAIQATFDSTLTGNVSSSVGKQLQASRKKKYGYITLDGESMAAAQEAGSGAFLDLVTQETDGIIEEHGDTLSFELYRDGNGIRGRRLSESSDVVTLYNSDDARYFKVGMYIGASANSDGSSPRTGTTDVTAVNEDGGTVTYDVSDISSHADDDYLFRVGDPSSCIEGLDEHMPLTAPASGDSFRGIDRSTDTRRLAGVRVDDTATQIEENAGLVTVKIGQVGQKATVLMLNPINFWQVARRLDAKVEYSGGGVKAAYGFEGFDVHTPAGTIRAVSDPDCPTNRGYVLNMSTWYWACLKPWTHIIRDDGRPNLRVSNEDAIEARTRSMGNPCCTKPGANGVFSI